MRHFLLFILAIIPLGLSAQRVEKLHFNTMVITLTDGTIEEVPLFTEPRITYQDSLFVVTTTLSTKTWPRNKVKGYTFRMEDGTGIENASNSNAQQVEWKLVDRQLRLSKLPRESTISLYTINGQHIMTTHRSGHCAINLNRLASGVYLFEVNGQFNKIVLS
ncbi:MAG: T9SS type A sorting domain-containing protein [Bacteroidaceae bacterium]|nr:T9SS type A sorting domain-containing protein [Bacteroidaceae bacterium]